jgi:nucleotide-binding universal stress UspA family protein
MSAPVFVVGYTATDAGSDAAGLAARLARASAGRVELVMVLPEEGRGAVVPPDAGYDAFVREQAAQWLAAASAKIPAGIAQATHLRYAESFAEGLMDAAADLHADYIVVGAARGTRGGRFGLGSVANELVHSSTVPVVLAPAGAADVDADVTRITAAVGTKPGADALLDESVALAAATGAPLRLVSLVAVDMPSGVDTGVIRLAGAAHADRVLQKARGELPEGVDAEATVAAGESIEEAVANLGWQPGEVVMVGSSRLAQPRRLFLGSTASKMLRELPVPMIVVPRTRTHEGAQR